MAGAYPTRISVWLLDLNNKFEQTCRRQNGLAYFPEWQPTRRKSFMTPSHREPRREVIEQCVVEKHCGTAIGKLAQWYKPFYIRFLSIFVQG
jgi:hypothetical protein